MMQLWSLHLRGEVLGVRACVAYKNYFDIDIDTYNKNSSLPVGALSSLELFERGDMLLTKEEIESGLVIQDGSKDSEFLGLLQKASYALLERKNKEDRQKLKKKKADIENSFRHLVPRAWFSEYVDFHLETFEGNKDPYKGLNAKQQEEIKAYTRWRTRLLFDENNVSRKLVAKGDKTEKLVALMVGVEDWQYDGTVDTGGMGGGHCELGHALRYEHYAISPSTDRSLIFGATCMSDFFKVDKKILDRIVQVQTYIMNEIKVVVFLVVTGKKEEFEQSYKSETWELLKHYKGQFNEKIKGGAGWARFMGAFLQEGIPFTKSLIDAMQKLSRIKIQEDYEKKKEEDKANREAMERELEAKRIEAMSQAEARAELDRLREEKVSSRQEQVDPFVRILLALDDIEKSTADGKLHGHGFALKIVPTIRNTSKISPNQEKYIESAYNAIIREERNPLTYREFVYGDRRSRQVEQVPVTPQNNDLPEPPPEQSGGNGYAPRDVPTHPVSSPSSNLRGNVKIDERVVSFVTPVKAVPKAVTKDYSSLF